MNPFDTTSLPCPYCGALIELEIDNTSGNQKYIEDCHICCRPINVSVTLGYNDITEIGLTTDDE